MFGNIYRITNGINGKCYIGATTQDNPETRWIQHKCDAKLRCYKMPIHNAINKYGADSFSFEVIAKCETREMMNTMERAFISLFNSEYNVQKGGDFSGKHSKETKAKMSNHWAENRHDDHIVAVDKYDLDGNLINSYNSILEAKKDTFGFDNGGSISQVCQGKILTTSGYVFRYKGEPFNKFPIKGKTTPKMVLQINPKDNSVVNEFDSIASANRYLGVGRSSNISRVCKGIKGYKTAYGFKWKYNGEGR